MFGTKIKSKTDKGTLQSTNVLETTSQSCVIGQGTTIEGSFISKEDVRLDGKLIGELKVEKRLVMGENGLIDGNATCNGSSISGKIKGEIHVDGTLHLSQSAFVNGKIRAKKLVVDEGASYTGECLIGEQHFK